MRNQFMLFSRQIVYDLYQRDNLLIDNKCIITSKDLKSMFYQMYRLDYISVSYQIYLFPLFECIYYIICASRSPSTHVQNSCSGGE